MSTYMPPTEEPRWGRPLPPEAISLEDDDLRKVAAALVQGEDPEQGWIRYLRTLTLLALHRWLKQRDAAVVVGPELEPEAPDRLLAIGGRATQLLCASSLAEEVAVPLSPWKQTATAPQLVLLALVDEENAVVEFPGVIDAAALIAEIQKVGGGAGDAIELPTALFQGGVDRLLRWVTLLKPEALPRVGLSGAGLSREAEHGGMEELQKWLNQLLSGQTLVPVPVVGTRGGAPTEVRLITPVVQKTADGSLMAQAVCATPSIWAAVPLAEIELEADGQVMWQQRANRQYPIEGPIPWPLEPLLPHQRITIRLRPQEAPGGAYAVVTLQAPDACVMKEGEEMIRQGLVDPVVPELGANVQNGALTTEIHARHLLHSDSKANEVESCEPREEMLRTKVQKMIKDFGEGHTSVANSLQELATLLYAQGQYPEAELQCLRSLEIYENNLGPEHTDVAKSLNTLALLLQAKGQYGTAEPFYRRSLAIREKALGPNHPDVATTLNNLADLMSYQGLFSAAEPIYRRSLAIREKALGPNHPDVANSLNNVADLLSNQGKYSAAELLYRQSLCVREKALGPNHPDVATSLNSLAMLLQLQGQYGAADHLYRRSLEIREKAFGLNHPDVATSLNNLALLLQVQGQYCEAEPLYRRSLEIREKVLGPNHPDVATTLNNLAGLLRNKGDYAVAEPLYRRSLAIREEALGPNHPDIATSLNNLALLLQAQGEYLAAEQLQHRSLAIREISLGSDHVHVACSLNNLAMLFRLQGRYGEAELLYRRSLAICEMALGPDHLDVTFILNNLAELLDEKGQYSEAKPLFYRCLALREKAVGPNHPNVASSLNNLARLLQGQGYYSEAEPHFRRSLAIFEMALGPYHPDVATSLNNLAMLFRLQGRYGEAEPLYRRSLEIREKALGPNHPDVATSLNNLALLLQDQDEYCEAEPLYRRSLAICKMTLGPEHVWTAIVLSNLVLLCTASHQYSIAAEYLAVLARSALTWLHRELPLMAATRRGVVSKKILNLASGFSPSVSHFLPINLFVHQNFHGLLQQVEQLQTGLAKLPGEHQPIVAELRSLITLLSSSQVEIERRRSLAEKRDELEIQLYRLYPDLELKTVEVSNVAAALPADAALIEFQYFIPHVSQSSAEITSASYLAFILFPNEKIEVIDFGTAEPLEAVINEVRANTLADDPDAAENWRTLSERLLAPLLPHLKGVKRWYLTLDGELHRVPFHVLPLPSEPDKLLVETVTLQLLTSSRDLLIHQLPSDGPSSMADAMVVADPAFDHTPGSQPQTHWDPYDYQPRSRNMGALSVWAQLPNSAIEGRQIAELIGATLHTGSQATTVTVQQAKRPRVLHIATHGFFLPDQSEPKDHHGWLSLDCQDLLARFRGEDPMLRSGLVFAGANHPVADPSEDDGYLTAQEAVHLDLQGTELVTLSACDAGSGDIRTGEGVYGLQRALIVAGARSMLLSLWPVPDAATCEFMVRFYTLLKQGAGRFDALVAVQREFRQHGNVRWRHPYYWGAWQLIGDGGPISGL